MKILLVSATLFEIQNFTRKFENVEKISGSHYTFHLKTLDIDVLISGIGPVFSCYQLTKFLGHRQYDLIINAGIAGSYSADLKIGDLVNVTTDCFADLGINGPEKFSTLFEEGFMNEDEFPFKHGKLVNNDFPQLVCLKKTPEVSGITVNSVNGNRDSILKAKEKYNPQVESMEGAAVFFVSRLENVKVLQLKAISNYVEPRNKSNWNIPRALKNLHSLLTHVLEELNALDSKNV